MNSKDWRDWIDGAERNGTLSLGPMREMLTDLEAAERRADALREAREALRAAHGMHAGDVTAYCAVCALLARADAALSGAELDPGYTAAQMREAYLQGVEDCSDDYGLNLSAETISRFRAEAKRRATERGGAGRMR